MAVTGAWDFKQLDLMFSFLKMGCGKPNIPVLKENLDWLRRAMTQKTAGQQPYAKTGDVDWAELATRLNIIVIEAMQLYLSGGLNESEYEKMTLDEAITHCIEITRRDDVCEECKAEHGQLAAWLTELKVLREREAE